MSKRLTALSLVLILSSLLIACTGEQASVSYETGDLIYENAFDDPTSWESFGYVQTQFGVVDGKYAAVSAGGGYIPVTNGETHSNAVLEATVTQVSSSENTAFGIICRSQPSNPIIGYYFLIASDGSYGIRIGESNRVRVLVPWTQHNAINTGQDSTNTIRAVCIDDYFAMYINGQFVAEERHNWLEQGVMSLVVSSPDSVQVAAEFDDVTIYEATLNE
ncbi:MAG: hypothetical protein AAFV98_09560 [Chloroflexota bacterium]